MKKELIVCAAVRPAISVKKTIDMSIVCGPDYEYIFKSKALKLMIPEGKKNIFKLGFVTNAGRFVDSMEALQIASESGQYATIEQKRKSANDNIEYLKAYDVPENKNIDKLNARIQKEHDYIKSLDLIDESKGLKPDMLW